MNVSWFLRMRRELSIIELNQLNAVHPYAEERYVHYRRKGHGPEDALQYALAWGRNLTEQRKRRRSHGTGYVP